MREARKGGTHGNLAAGTGFSAGAGPEAREHKFHWIRSPSFQVIAMLAVIQRVARAAVHIGDRIAGQIDRGLLILLAIGPDDDADDARWLAEKIVGLRIFGDAAGKMNLSLEEVGGSLLVVSQFTLYGDCRKGRRPSFIGAAAPDRAIPLYEQFINQARALGINVQAGEFGADMNVELVNAGPVTLILESKAR